MKRFLIKVIVTWRKLLGNIDRFLFHEDIFGRTKGNLGSILRYRVFPNLKLLTIMVVLFYFLCQLSRSSIRLCSHLGNIMTVFPDNFADAKNSEAKIFLRWRESSSWKVNERPDCWVLLACIHSFQGEGLIVVPSCDPKCLRRSEVESRLIIDFSSCSKEIMVCTIFKDCEDRVLMLL